MEKKSPSQPGSADFGRPIPDSTGESNGAGLHRSTEPALWLDPRRLQLAEEGSAEKGCKIISTN